MLRRAWVVANWAVRRHDERVPASSSDSRSTSSSACQSNCGSMAHRRPERSQKLAAVRRRARVVRLKNRFLHSPGFGYRDMLLNVDMDGHVCEIQMGLLPLVAVRRRMHKYYGVIRSGGTDALRNAVKPL